MNRSWLSATWEAHWRSFQYFNFYRLLLAMLLALAVNLPGEWTARLLGAPDPSLFGLVAVYGVLVVSGWLLSIYWLHHFNSQLSLQVLLDVVVAACLLYAAGGVASGLGVLLLVSLTAASLVGRGQLVLLYAALATLAVLGAQVAVVLAKNVDFASLFPAGLISAAFFAMAILARWLGQRLMSHEELARRRGVALDNQVRISQRVVERMQDGILIVTADGAIVRSNPVASRMLGEGADRSGRLPPILATGLASWRQGCGPVSFEFAADGGGELRVRFESTESSEGECLLFLEDLGHVRAQAQQLKLAALGRLTASIAHEIRNPLSAISHAGELLREECADPLAQRLLRIIGDNVGRLDRIVGDVLDLGRQGQAAPEALPLRDYCSALRDDFCAAVGVDREILVLDLDPGLRLVFDRAQLRQVLWNLWANGLRYASGRPGALRVYAQAGASAETVELHCLDDGPGVPTADQEKIFEPFFTTHHQGTGLGLFIARELCAANGAQLALMASAQGAHFILTGRCDQCLQQKPSDPLVVA